MPIVRVIGSNVHCRLQDFGAFFQRERLSAVVATQNGQGEARLWNSNKH